MNASAASNQVLIQELTGVQTRISFPTLKEALKNADYVKVLNAQLEVKPVTSRYSSIHVYPPALNMYYYNINTGVLLGPAEYTSGANANQAQTGDLYIDYNYGKDTRYVYELTAWVNNELAATSYTTQSLVMVAANADTQLNALVAGTPGNASYKTRLIVSLLLYNK